LAISDHYATPSIAVWRRVKSGVIRREQPERYLIMN